MDLKLYRTLLATCLLSQAAMHGAILQAFGQAGHIESAAEHAVGQHVEAVQLKTYKSNMCLVM